MDRLRVVLEQVQNPDLTIRTQAETNFYQLFSENCIDASFSLLSFSACEAAFHLRQLSLILAAQQIPRCWSQFSPEVQQKILHATFSRIQEGLLEQMLMNPLATLISSIFLSADRGIKGETMQIIIQMLDCTDERSATFIYYALNILLVIAEESSAGEESLLIEVLVFTYPRIRKLMDVISTSTMESNIAHATDGIMKCIAKFMNQCMTKLSFSVLSGGVDIFDEFACHANNAVDGCRSFNAFYADWSEACVIYLERCTSGGALAIYSRLGILLEISSCLKVVLESFPAQVAEDEETDPFHHRVVHCSLEILRTIKDQWTSIQSHTQAIGHGEGSGDADVDLEQLVIHLMDLFALSVSSVETWPSSSADEVKQGMLPIVFHFMQLTESKRMEMVEEPNTFVFNEQPDSYETNIRMCGMELIRMFCRTLKEWCFAAFYNASQAEFSTYLESFVSFPPSPSPPPSPSSSLSLSPHSLWIEAVLWSLNTVNTAYMKLLSKEAKSSHGQVKTKTARQRQHEETNANRRNVIALMPPTSIANFVATIVSSFLLDERAQVQVPPLLRARALVLFAASVRLFVGEGGAWGGLTGDLALKYGTLASQAITPDVVFTEKVLLSAGAMVAPSMPSGAGLMTVVPVAVRLISCKAIHDILRHLHHSIVLPSERFAVLVSSLIQSTVDLSGQTDDNTVFFVIELLLVLIRKFPTCISDEGIEGIGHVGVNLLRVYSRDSIIIDMIRSLFISLLRVFSEARGSDEGYRRFSVVVQDCITFADGVLQTVASSSSTTTKSLEPSVGVAFDLLNHISDCLSCQSPTTAADVQHKSTILVILHFSCIRLQQLPRNQRRLEFHRKVLQALNVFYSSLGGTPEEFESVSGRLSEISSCSLSLHAESLYHLVVDSMNDISTSTDSNSRNEQIVQNGSTLARHEAAPLIAPTAGLFCHLLRFFGALVPADLLLGLVGRSLVLLLAQPSAATTHLDGRGASDGDGYIAEDGGGAGTSLQHHLLMAFIHLLARDSSATIKMVTMAEQGEATLPPHVFLMLLEKWYQLHLCLSSRYNSAISSLGLVALIRLFSQHEVNHNFALRALELLLSGLPDILMDEQPVDNTLPNMTACEGGDGFDGDGIFGFNSDEDSDDSDYFDEEDEDDDDGDEWESDDEVEDGMGMGDKAVSKESKKASTFAPAEMYLSDMVSPTKGPIKGRIGGGNNAGEVPVTVTIVHISDHFVFSPPVRDPLAAIDLEGVVIEMLKELWATRGEGTGAGAVLSGLSAKNANLAMLLVSSR